MASELVSCPECKRKLRVPTELIGRHVKCPTCGHTFTADPATQAPPPPAAVEEKPARTSKVSRDEKEDDDEEDEERSRRKRLSSRREDDDEDEDRPRRRRSRSSRDDDEDDDDRPRRSSRRRGFIPHRGGAVLTMGILGLVLSVVPMVPMAGLVLAIIAWVMGNADLAEMRAGRMDPEGEGQTNTGRVCGIIAVVLWVVALVAVFGYFFCMCVGLGAMGAAGGPRH